MDRIKRAEVNGAIDVSQELRGTSWRRAGVGVDFLYQISASVGAVAAPQFRVVVDIIPCSEKKNTVQVNKAPGIAVGGKNVFDKNGAVCGPIRAPQRADNVSREVDIIASGKHVPRELELA